MEKLSTIALDQLATVSGGMQWEQFCQSYNVEDRRRGAPSRPEQIRRTDEANRANGCPTWSELHPGKPIPKRW